MCGRFVGYRNIEQLKQYFPIDRSACEFTANFNVAPGQEILAIVRQGNSNVLDKFHWELVPFRAEDTAMSRSMMNKKGINHVG